MRHGGGGFLLRERKYELSTLLALAESDSPRRVCLACAGSPLLWQRMFWLEASRVVRWGY